MSSKEGKIKGARRNFYQKDLSECNEHISLQVRRAFLIHTESIMLNILPKDTAVNVIY
jgi:hypothetical protein